MKECYDQNELNKEIEIKTSVQNIYDQSNAEIISQQKLCKNKLKLIEN